VTAAATAVRSNGCKGGRSDQAQLRSLSLFENTITASIVTLRLTAARSVAIRGLRVEGRPTNATAGKRIPLAQWGYLVSDPGRVPTRSGFVTSALAVHVLKAHGGLRAGTVILVAVAGVHQPAAVGLAKAGKQATHEPLNITPPLALTHYIFPVQAPAEYIDTYGAFRSDVPGNWHHGDDIFAPLGTPVVAVATGTINRVGWEHLGGWRLWVRDNAGDEFYYAHLSGYTPGDLHSNRVKAGQVIGFIGNTGDAFTTSPHLHFEIHPRSLLHLGYDGAVDPTSYLNHWVHLTHIHVPTPVHPPLPTDPPLRNEARYVFRELLAARHLIRHAPSPSQRPHVHIPNGANGAVPPALATAPPEAESAAALPPNHHSDALPPLIFALLVGLGSVTVFAVTTAIAKTSLPGRIRTIALPATPRPSKVLLAVRRIATRRRR
jgi:murein DD-endopeptidase MepM/ murein hydrolase activator NlpD